MNTQKYVCLQIFGILVLSAAILAWSPRNHHQMEEADWELQMMEQGMDEVMEEGMRADNTDWAEETMDFRADSQKNNGSSSQGGGQGGGGGGNTPRPCSPVGKCFSNDDCGDKGRCLGLFVGTCDCSTCLPASLCNAGAIIGLGQQPCGGLRNACNATTNLCNCEAGYKAAGFKNTGDALLKMCNKQKCDANSDTCNGLPCKAGFCTC